MRVTQAYDFFSNFEADLASFQAAVSKIKIN